MQDLEQMIATQADMGPRVHPKDIENNIVDCRFFTAYQGAYAAAIDGSMSNMPEPRSDIPRELHLLTICVLTLRNGFTVLGQSACASEINYNQQIGEKIARDNAVNQVWGFMGYELRSLISAMNMADRADGNDLVGSGDGQAGLDQQLDQLKPHVEVIDPNTSLATSNDPFKGDPVE